MSDCFHSESENCKFQTYRFNAEDPGQSLYTPTTVGVIKHWKTQGRRSCSGQGGHGPCTFLLLITSSHRFPLNRFGNRSCERARAGLAIGYVNHFREVASNRLQRGFGANAERVNATKQLNRFCCLDTDKECS